MTSRAPTFRLPKDGRTYIEQILERCNSLIQCNVWGDLHPSCVRSWMKNFTTDAEKYFAACVLDSLIYRSKDQTVALIRQLFQRALPDLTRLDPGASKHVEDWQELFNNQPLTGYPQARLVAAVTSNSPPTKSAHVIARYMMQDLSIPERWIINPWEAASHAAAGADLFIFVDDFLGTGEQFERLVRKEKLASFFSSNYVIYAPLTAHAKGIIHLKTLYKDLRVCPVELLDESYGIFHDKSASFADQINSPDSAKKFYYDLLKRKNISVPDRRGFGHLELAYAFAHGTPDNCLPILWWRKGWKPLFKHRV